MTHLNQHHDPISTVQLSPFVEEQWNRIVTYSPIYLHWTDMLTMTQQRTNKTSSGKLNVVGLIDMNNLKLEDELLLNELHDLKKTAAASSKSKTKNDQLKVVDNKPDCQEVSSAEDYLASSDSFQKPKEPLKNHSNWTESIYIDQANPSKYTTTSNQTIPSQVSIENKAKKLPNLSPGRKHPHSAMAQLRQTTLAREHALSAANDRRSSSPLSISSKRTILSAHSSRHHYQQQKSQTSKSSLSNDMNTLSNTPEQLPRESSSSLRASRARSCNSSRSALHMVKAKNDRIRQRQNTALKTLLVEPWKQMIWGDGVTNETIPNSLDIMHKMCGSGTAFERNLRYVYQRQLNQYRNSSIKS